ncbi:MAG: uncharacterized protein KVP18_000148 [Porospora cf. gigantea A]|nr:MAG: hypothetical protein KVP18_000148 [Porospora cf. gigantea A]
MESLRVHLDYQHILDELEPREALAVLRVMRMQMDAADNNRRQNIVIDPVQAKQCCPSATPSVTSEDSDSPIPEVEPETYVHFFKGHELKVRLMCTSNSNGWLLEPSPTR